MANFSLRKIRPEDNAAVAEVIRVVMTEFGAVGAGFSIEDPEVDNMFGAYQAPRSVFYVVTQNDQVLGCGGVAPLAGGDPLMCELKKMYFMPSIRGQGAGRVLAELLINEARLQQFAFMYIETLERMEAANYLYQRLGFEPTSCQGNTGHCGCDRFYLLEIDEHEPIVIGEQLVK